MEFLKSTIKQTGLSALIYAVMGIFFVIKPDTAFVTIGRLLASMLLIYGILQVCMYFTEKNYAGVQRNGMTSGLIVAMVAIFLLLKPEITQTIVGYALGFSVLIAGITQFQNALDLMHFKLGRWPALLITGIVEVVLGIIALIDPFKADQALIFAIGIFLIVCAVCKLIAIILVGMGIRALKIAAAEAAAVDVTDESKESDESQEPYEEEF